MTEMTGWHHRLNGLEIEQTLGDSERWEAWSAAIHGVTKSQTVNQSVSSVTQSYPTLCELDNYQSFSFSISPSNKYSGLISFRIDWLDLLAVQGILKSLLQHHSLKISILQHSAFFMAQLSHPYLTTGKTKALTRQTFVSKVRCLLFNTNKQLNNNKRVLSRNEGAFFVPPLAVTGCWSASLKAKPQLTQSQLWNHGPY